MFERLCDTTDSSDVEVDKVFCLDGYGSENNDLEDDCLEDDRMEVEFEEMGAWYYSMCTRTACASLWITFGYWFADTDCQRD